MVKGRTRPPAGANEHLCQELAGRNEVLEGSGRRPVTSAEPPESGEISFSDLFDVGEIQKLQDAFAEAMNVASIITHPDGTPITRPSKFCRLCIGIIRKTDKGLANCYHSDSVIGRQNPEGPIIQPCLSGGLWDSGASITLGGKHIANWLIGQVKNEAIDEEKVVLYADEIGADREEFRKALQEVPVMSKEQFQKVAQVLFLFANELSLKAYQNVQQARYIARLRQAESALEDSRNYLYRIINSVADPIFVKDRQHRFELVNDAFCSYTGRGREELLGQSDYAFFPQDQADVFLAKDELVYTTGAENVNEEELTDARGDVRVIITKKTLYTDKKGEKHIVGIIRDTTDHKRAVRALQESERRLSALMSNLPGIVYRCKNDRDWTMEFISDGCLPLSGYTPEDFYAGRLTYNGLIHPGERDYVWESIQKAVADRRPFQLVYRLLPASGGMKWVWEQGWGVFQAGELLALEGFITDITDRRQAEVELREYKDHLEELVAERTANLKEVNSALQQEIAERKSAEEALQDAKAQAELYLDLMGHDIANLNQVGMGFLELALGLPDLDGECRALISRPLEALESSTKLIDNVRKLQRARAGSLLLHDVEIGAMIRGLIPKYSGIAGRDIAIRFTGCDCTAPANDLLADVFSNLLGNAIKHSCGPLAIDIRLSKVREEDGEFCRVALEDNGPGIPDELKPRLFTRYQRGATKASGSGLGLYLAKALVENFGGLIWAEDRVSGDYHQGTRFVVLLPTSQAGARALRQ